MNTYKWIVVGWLGFSALMTAYYTNRHRPTRGTGESLLTIFEIGVVAYLVVIA